MFPCQMSMTTIPSINDAGKTLNNTICLTSTPTAKWKPGPKSKTMRVKECDISNTKNQETVTNKICENGVITNKKSNLVDSSSDKKCKVLPINTDTGNTLYNQKCITTTLRKRKPGPKSKTMRVKECDISNTENQETVTNKICENGVITNKKSNLVDSSSDKKCKVLPINTDTGNTLYNQKCITTTLRKRKPGPKSKTMYVEDEVLLTTENNNSEVISYKKSKTNLLDCSLVTKLKPAGNPNPNSCFKFSSKTYPPPFPFIPPHNSQPLWNNVPPIPKMKIDILGNIVTLTWNSNLTWKTADIKMYELFVCQETDARPDISMWKKKGNLKAERLPMACELEMFELGFIYHFALRAVDVYSRCTPFVVQQAKI